MGEQFGVELYGTKGNAESPEGVYLKRMKEISGDSNKDYPLIDTKYNRKYLLSI